MMNEHPPISEPFQDEFGGDEFGQDSYNPELESQEYKHFPDEKSRKELVAYAVGLAGFLHDAEIKNMVLLDRSARPFYIAVREAWHHFLPNDEMPGIFFANPKGFQDTQEQHPTDIFLEQLASIPKGDFLDHPDPDRSFQKITGEVATTYPGLVKDKDKNLLVFDTCMHTGQAMGSVMSVLHEAGFNKLMMGTVSPSTSEHDVIKPDFSLTPQKATKKCHPFGEDFMVNKTFNQLLSLPNRDKADREYSRDLRKEIKRIMEEYLPMFPPDLLDRNEQ